MGALAYFCVKDVESAKGFVREEERSAAGAHAPEELATELVRASVTEIDPVVGRVTTKSISPAAQATGSADVGFSYHHGASSISLKIEDKQLATEVIRGAAAVGLGALICHMNVNSIPFAEVALGFGIGAGVAGVAAGVVYFWKKNSERAVREALEERPAAGAHAPDPEVEEIRSG